MPLFQGKHSLERDALYWHFPHNRMEVTYYMGSAILQDDWKFYQGHGLIDDALFNLKTDPMEKANVLKTNPHLADRLREKLSKWLNTVDAKMPIVVPN